MKLDLSDIANNPGMRTVRQFSEWLPEDTGISCLRPMEGELVITNTGSRLLIEGELAGEIELPCSRCLEMFSFPCQAEFEEEFKIEGGKLAPAGDAEEEAASRLLEGDELDVTELIRQNVVLHTPLQPICREACRGLCDRCGKNLNEGDCDCPKADTASALGKLGDLWAKRKRSRKPESSKQ